jgi:AcrR family transcriptional regulator
MFSPVATQHDRRTETRRRLLEAAAELFAARGIAAATVDAIAERAGRTVGALYNHFTSKEDLLFAVVDEWLGGVSAVATAELAGAATTDERLAAMWHAVTRPAAGDGRWIGLEHELWSYATRHPAVRRRLRHRYQQAWADIEATADMWPDLASLRGRGAEVMGLLAGLSMMQEIDPPYVTDAVAVRALRTLVGAPALQEGTSA